MAMERTGTLATRPPRYRSHERDQPAGAEVGAPLLPRRRASAPALAAAGGRLRRTLSTVSPRSSRPSDPQIGGGGGASSRSSCDRTFSPYSQFKKTTSPRGGSPRSRLPAAAKKSPLLQAATRAAAEARSTRQLTTPVAN
eukprot:COSAG01_NODE_4270_length_5189_cov_2.508242_6_plen_140_part_00